MIPRSYVFVLVVAATTFSFTLLALYRIPSGVLQGVGMRYLKLTTTKDEPHPSPERLGMPNGPQNGSAYESILVLATMAEIDNSWVGNGLGDLLKGDMRTAFYVSDNISAPLHTPANKGNEAMSYLTYIIDFYDALPEISIFIHSHEEAWHNNYLLGLSSSLIVRNLNHEKVVRDGYMNLRCHWSPGCPKHLNPLATKLDRTMPEEMVVKDAWKEVFPFDELPKMLAQPCCSQFAASRERLRTVPVERYVHFRDWLLNTDLPNSISGRLFEYFWQYILNSSPIFCPDPRICYCDGYNVCFEDAADYQRYFEVATEWQKLYKELQAWEEENHISKRGQEGEQESKRGSAEVVVGRAVGEKLNPNVIDKWDRGDWLNWHIDQLVEEMAARRDEALAAGRDPARKAAALRSAARSPLKKPQGKPPWWF